MSDVGAWPNPEIPTFDRGGTMVPPWIKYPNLPKGSMGWRMGQGEDYLSDFRKWLLANTRESRVEVMKNILNQKNGMAFMNTKNHSNNRMQSDKLLRCAPQFAADARRYVA